MPCGKTFENVTGISKRTEIEYTEEELEILKNAKEDLELDFQNLAGEKGTKIFENQTKVAKEIVDIFKKGSIINTMVVSPTQSGKTGIICETIRYFVKETNISYKNIYIITGLSSVEWKIQTKNRLPDKLRKRVYHRNDLLDRFYRDIERKRNVLIILDEIQIASSKNQTIHKVFDELNYMNLKTLLKKDVKFLEITATPNGCIYDLMKWGDEFTHKIIVQPPESYTSCFKLFDEGRVKQFRDLCENQKDKETGEYIHAIDNVEELKNTIDEFYKDDPRFHFIRTKAAELQDKTINNFKEVFGESVNIKSFDFDNEEDDINNIVCEKPKEHTFIFIKEKLRCAKTIENKNLVGIYYERYTKSIPDDDIIIQGMLGRATGYNDNGDSIIYTNVPSIDKYKKLLETNFNDMTINWISSSTVMRKNKIKSKNYYNAPDNVKGFKVIEYDNDIETVEERKARIALQKQEREQKKQEREQMKEEKKRLKEAKLKEKEELKEKKKQEREQMKEEKKRLKEIKLKEKEKIKEKKSNENKIDEYKKNFKLKIKHTLKLYSDEYKEINNKEIESDILKNYVNEICNKTFEDENFNVLIQEHGDPFTWNSDIFQQFIEKFSNIYTEYSMKHENIEDIPEIKPKKLRKNK